MQNSQWMEVKFSSRHSELVKCKHLPHHRMKWSNNTGQVPFCTWHQAGAPWETGVPSSARDPLRPWESPTLRSADKCCRCPSCLLFSLGWLGDSHASTQCLNKRVYLIQLSPQGRAKWVPVLFDRDNERGREVGRRTVIGGLFWGWRGRLELIHTVILFFSLHATLDFNVSVMSWLIQPWMAYFAVHQHHCSNKPDGRHGEGEI